MNQKSGHHPGTLLDGSGGGQKISWEEVRKWSPDQGILWVHLDYTDPKNRTWIKKESGLEEVVCEALLSQETRPRSAFFHDGLLLTFRGVNTHPESNPEDMIAIRLWINHHHIISTQKRKLLSVDDLEAAIRDNQGPKTAGQFLVDLASNLVGRMSDVIEDIEDTVDNLQEQVLTMESYELRTQLANIRRQTIGLRRYLGPQREAMTRLYNERVPWLEEIERIQLREIADRTTRYVEDLDSARERAAVTQEELINRLSEQLNKRMYLLTMVAAVFLPLSFLTGLLGINVGGIPGAEDKSAFLTVCLILGGVVTVQLILLKMKKWF